MSNIRSKREQAVNEMLRERRERQQQMDLVILEQMIPENHLLRKIDQVVDFSFIHELCAPNDTGESFAQKD